MREWGAHTKRPHSPDTTPAPRSSARKRTRIGGKARNINKGVWRKVQQHVLWRNDYHMDTEVFIDDVKQDFSNVRRRILRAGAIEVEHVKDRRSLPTLPTYIKLNPPLPELAAPPNFDMVNGEPSLEPAPQEQEIVPSSISSQSSCTTDTESDEFTSEDDEDHTTKIGNAFLGRLPLYELIDALRVTEAWYHERPSDHTLVSVTGCPHKQMAIESETLETFTNALKLNPSVPQGRYSSHLKVILMLIREGETSTSHFLETVIRSLRTYRRDQRPLAIWRWLTHNIEEFPDIGTRALGAAARNNDYEAVNILLDEGVDINGSISGPHTARGCYCQISVIAYTQLPCLDGEDAHASAEMIAYLLFRGATESVGVDVGLLGFLDCVLRQEGIDAEVFRFRFGRIFRRIRGFGGVVCVTGSFLETSILEPEYFDWSEHHRFSTFEYLLEEAGKISSCSPLAALIYRYGPLDFSENLPAKLLAMTENINGYCHSVSLRKHSMIHNARPQPYNITQSMTPLQAAALRGSEEIIHLLLQHGADIDCPARGTGGVTPLQAICSLKRESLACTTKMRIAQLFIDRGANVNASPAWNLGLSALQAAALVGDVEVAELLVSRGAIVNAPACKHGGGTALALAARRGHLDMVQFLLKNGAAIPAPGVRTFSFGEWYEDNKTISDLLRLSAWELLALYGDNGTPSQDYRRYEARWKEDPTYENS